MKNKKKNMYLYIKMEMYLSSYAYESEFEPTIRLNNGNLSFLDCDRNEISPLSTRE